MKLASCVKIKCNGEEECIGADKISHFFQQGFMLYEVSQQNNSDEYADAFSKWTEGLYAKPSYSTFDHPNTVASQIYFWLRHGTVENRGFGYKLTGKYKNKWGNIAGLGGVFSKPSVGDHNANMAGMRFWEKLSEQPGSTSFTFNICDYLTSVKSLAER